MGLQKYKVFLLKPLYQRNQFTKRFNITVKFHEKKTVNGFGVSNYPWLVPCVFSLSAPSSSVHVPGLACALVCLSQSRLRLLFCSAVFLFGFSKLLEFRVSVSPPQLSLMSLFCSLFGLSFAFLPSCLLTSECKPLYLFTLLYGICLVRSLSPVHHNLNTSHLLLSRQTTASPEPYSTQGYFLFEGSFCSPLLPSARSQGAQYIIL